jgi:nucleoid DNA-binding protein
MSRPAVDTPEVNPYSRALVERGGEKIFMTKAELIERVYGRKQVPRELTKKALGQIVDAVFTEMGDYFIRSKVTRKQSAKLTYPGFGTFSKRHRNERVVKVPGTGAAVTIPSTETVTFSPGRELRALLNRNGNANGASHGANHGANNGKSHGKPAGKSSAKPE